MSVKARNLWLLLLIWALIVTATVTLLPLPAPKQNDLGYVSACPFAPWSTLALLFVAGVTWAIRQYLMVQRD